MNVQNLYLIITILCYVVYFIKRLPDRLNFLEKWKKHHYEDEKENNCSDIYSEKCLQSGELIEHYMINNIRYIGIRILSIFNKNLFPLVFLDNLSNVINHLLILKKSGFHYFQIYHFTCFIIDFFLIFLNNNSED